MEVTSGYSSIYIFLIVGVVEYILCIDLQSIYSLLQVVATMLGSKYFICKIKNLTYFKVLSKLAQ